MRSLLVAVILLAAVGCSKSSTAPDPTTPPTPSVTRVIGLRGALAFGAIQVGSSASATLTITNDGNSALTVTELTASAGILDSLSGNWTHGTIAPGTSQTVTIRFTPTAAKAYNGTLAVSGDQTAGAGTIAVSGTGVAGSAPTQCSFELSIGTTIDGYPNGGSFPVAVSTASGCAWTATAAAAWLHIPASASGVGPASLIFSADANNTEAGRTATLTIAGHVVTFNQTPQLAPGTQIGPPFVVSGAVTGAGGAVTSATVQMLNGSAVVATAQTNSSGRYSLTVSLGGTFTLSISVLGYQTFTRTLILVPGVATTGLDGINAALVSTGSTGGGGQLSMPSCSPIANGLTMRVTNDLATTLRASFSGPTTKTVDVSPGGTQTTSLAAGRYTVATSASGYTNLTGTFTLSNGCEYRLTISAR
jgi:Abnormal spindle-like microcephaly-assoc'd, ASPM-SPD-2-Hydin/Carboxypeptidase regulatory-like domain/Viral BACON domain